MELKVKKFRVGPLETNCYVVYDEKSRECFILDPGYNDPRITEFINSENLKAIFIINTHGHFDHIAGNQFLASTYQIPVLIHYKDSPMLEDPFRNHSSFFGIAITFKGEIEEIKEERILIKGPFKLQILETPGHTAGSISILIEDLLFTGDTLFVESIGRTDFPESEPEKIQSSIQKLAKLPENLTVHPGHMASAPLKEIKRRNPFLKS